MKTLFEKVFWSGVTPLTVKAEGGFPPRFLLPQIFSSGCAMFVLALAWFFIPICFFILSPLTAWSQRAEFTLQTIDSETKLPLPCRLEVKNQRGIAQRVEELPFWYDHFVSPGSATMRLPVGTYPMKIERGLEYLPVQGHFVLNRSAKDTKTESLRRFTNLAKKGWWSGDLLVLRPQREIEALMLGDDVHFVPLLGESNPGEPEHWFDTNRVYTTRNRFFQQGDLSLTLLNLPAEIDWQALKLEEQVSPIPFLYVLKKKYP
ncbi:MAG: hypothetical protein Q4E67_04005, partial [Planctomycetia bacterium]|nr:hypothetical protein [Planctomycetia bacterium]